MCRFLWHRCVLWVQQGYRKPSSPFTVAERGWRHVWMIRQRDTPHRFISSILASDRRRLSVRRTSGSQEDHRTYHPGSLHVPHGRIVRQPVLQFGVLGLLALQGTSTTVQGSGEHAPQWHERAARKRPPASAANNAHTERCAQTTSSSDKQAFGESTNRGQVQATSFWIPLS